MATKPKGNRWKTDFTLQGQRFVQYFNSEEEGKNWEALVRQMTALGMPLDTVAPPKRDVITLGKAHDMALEHWKGSKNELNASANARDIVEYLGNTFECEPGSPSTSTDCKRYRITARSNPGADRSVVMLQSTFATD